MNPGGMIGANAVRTVTTGNVPTPVALLPFRIKATQHLGESLHDLAMRLEYVANRLTHPDPKPGGTEQTRPPAVTLIEQLDEAMGSVASARDRILLVLERIERVTGVEDPDTKTNGRL